MRLNGKLDLDNYILSTDVNWEIRSFHRFSVRISFPLSYLQCCFK